jgi:hypothetical protein
MPSSFRRRIEAKSSESSDKQLDRLYDYTKFHIGIYLSAAGGIAALFGAAKGFEPLQAFIGNEDALFISLDFMVFAGMAGGIVASSTIECKTFEQFWSEPQGPYTFRFLRGQTWAAIEHFCFWVSLLFLAIAVVSGALEAIAKAKAPCQAAITAAHQAASAVLAQCRK